MYKMKHAVVLGLKRVFVFTWVLFFLQHSVKEESTSLFSRMVQENKEEHAFLVTKLYQKVRA